MTKQFRWGYVIAPTLIGLLVMWGCGVGKEIKRTGEEVRRAKREVKKRLDDLQLRVEMDFELQDAFRLVDAAYREAWLQGPINNWDDLARTTAATNSLGMRLSDARRKGIEVVFNLPLDLTDEQKADTIIAYAPTPTPDQYWILLASGKYDNVTGSELEAAKSPVQKTP